MMLVKLNAKTGSATWPNVNSLLQPWKLLVLFLLVLTLTGCHASLRGVLDPKGLIAYEERKLFFDTLALMLIVVLPVIIMSFAFAYHYRATHPSNDYKPNWSHSYLLECLWWGIPCAIILILAILTWQKTHELNPYSKIPGESQPPLIVQAIALPWKWLFIYPEQNIATVNYLEIPVGRQVEYWVTADNVPMSAFFIPQLGSQIYAMAGMRTRLHLIANEAGVYEGVNTLFNGDGFSDMHFSVHAVPQAEMDKWVSEQQHGSTHLDTDTYKQLLIPSTNNAPAFYSNVQAHLFNDVMNVYMNTFGPTHPRAAEGKLYNQIKL